MKETNKSFIRRNTERSFIILLIAVLGLIFASGSSAYAAGTNTAEEKPLREVHKVAVDGKNYCFFVKNNVVLTPEQIAGLTEDNDLVTEILKRAGLYMKETSCKKAEHTAITAEDWVKSGKSFSLGDADIDNIRNAAPADGEPVKLYMDLRISTEPADKEDDGTAAGITPTDKPVYSTRKMVGAKLLFVAVATEADAASGEDICADEKTETKTGTVTKEEPKKTDKQEEKKTKNVPAAGGGSGDTEEMLPEYRTINMTDRSGAPIKPTLEDGSPVSLEWIEPGKNANGEETGAFFEHIPGGLASVAAIAAVTAGIIAFFIVKKRRENEET